MKKEQYSLSVIFPTYECRKLIECSITSIQSWLDLADEVIIVDSHSSDSSGDFLAQSISHSNLKILKTPRGLYESWNAGIAHSTGKYIYISTAGDTIERSHLLHLLAEIEKKSADIIISVPQSLNPTNSRNWSHGWRTPSLIKSINEENILLLSKAEAFTYTFIDCPGSLMGSMASNLFRGQYLRERPFPIEYKRVGDTAWMMRYCGDCRIAISPRIGSTFLHHSSDPPLTPDEHYRFYRNLMLSEKWSILKTPALGSLRSLLRQLVIMKIRTRATWLTRKRPAQSKKTSLFSLSLIKSRAQYLCARLSVAIISFKINVYLKITRRANYD